MGCDPMVGHVSGRRTGARRDDHGQSAEGGQDAVGIAGPVHPVGTLVSPAARAQLNILDLVPVLDGGTPGEAIASTVDIARHAEKWGYQRYWMAEHHNMRGVASSSTAVLIGHVADQTETIRVGAGGIMLPNHAPYVVAEQFGTLATIYPGRIDRGLGRAPGTDPFTTRALRRNEAAAMNFAGEVEELIGYLGDPDPDAKVRAIPGEGTRVPIWILGSSHGGAQVAAALGLPYSFASHFAPAALMSALEVYRSRFTPSTEQGALAAPPPLPASTSWSLTRRLRPSGSSRASSSASTASSPADGPGCPSRRGTSRASWRSGLRPSARP